MGYVLMFHSLVRWVIVAVSVIASVKFALGWRGNSPFAKIDRGLQSGFSGLLDFQMLLGLTYLLWSGLSGGGWPAFRIEHAGTMVLAIVAAHLPARWKKQPDPIRFRNGLFAILGSLALIFVGIAILPQGWFK